MPGTVTPGDQATLGVTGDTMLLANLPRSKKFMRRPISPLLTLLLCCIAGSSGLASNSTSTDVAAITAIEREMTAAQNVDGVTRTWDDKVVWYDLMPAEIDDRKAAIARIADQFKPIKNLRTKILRMSVDTGGELGYAFSTQEFIADKKDGGPGLDFIFRETDIFKKKAGQWRLIHQQLSVPIDLATGQAVFTSKDWLVSTSKSN